MGQRGLMRLMKNVEFKMIKRSRWRVARDAIKTRSENTLVWVIYFFVHRVADYATLRTVATGGHGVHELTWVD